MMKYCDFCNYVYSDLQVEKARYNFNCPNCAPGSIQQTYSIGSTIHKEILKGEFLQVLNKKPVPPLGE